MAQARIGKIRLKDGATVLPFKAGSQIRSDRRDEFVRAVAQTFDMYYAEHSSEPDALVYVMGGVNQTARVAWVVQGDSELGATSVLALSQATIQRHISTR